MFYRRHLPHWQKPDSALFITWRLSGSLPKSVLARSRKELSEGKRFVTIDNELDKALYGPTWLKNPLLAAMIVESLWFGMEVKRLYQLCAFVVMSNHVHILIWPHARLARITQTLKGYTARQANLMLKRTGKTFWQDESFDHAVRNEQEFVRITRYIENNPMKAGLITAPADWPWSSAAENARRRLKSALTTDKNV